MAILPASNATAPTRILVIDDDQSIRALLTTVLTKKGYSVETARNGEEAIARIADDGFGAIILDLMMPKMDGFGVIEHMERTAPEKLRRSVIVLTAAAGRELRLLDASRVFRVLRKPFDLNDLIATVIECIGQAEAL